MSLPSLPSLPALSFSSSAALRASSFSFSLPETVMSVAVSWLRSEDPCAAKVKMAHWLSMQLPEGNTGETSRVVDQDPSEPISEARMNATAPKTEASTWENLDFSATPT